MIEIRITVDPALAAALEEHFCEDYQQCWMLYEDRASGEEQLRGFFDAPENARAAYDQLRRSFPALGSFPAPRTLEDRDWKEAYKLHFKPWSDRGLHWVPVWERDSYALPPGDRIVYLDPGMAFGTGNHETTRLCARRLLDAWQRWGKDGPEALARRSVIDAGCGSGILAISARKLGFGDIFAFDIDPDSVTISEDNARLCGVEGSITFRWADLQDGLAERSADVLMANILANVLIAHSEFLLAAVKPGGVLILSGILASEVEAMKMRFAERVVEAWGGYHTADSRTDGDWADLEFTRPA